MDFTKYLVDNAYVLIPVLYILGNIMKDSKTVTDKYIPIILLFIGVIFACGWLGFTMSSVIQGVLITGITVYSNQVIKQLQRNDISDEIQTITNPKEETESVNNIVNENSQPNGLIVDSAKSKGRVDNPENTIKDGAQVTVISASTPTI